MDSTSFESICITHILEGLRDGLSHFSQSSRVALIYAANPGDPPRVCDPQGLLDGHQPKLRDHYLYASSWRGQVPAEGLELLQDGEGVDLSGLISLGARSRSMNFQMWFTEEHPDMCSVGPTLRWLEYAAGLLSQRFVSRDVQSLDTAGFMLQRCATNAVRDHIVDERSRMGWLDSQVRVYPFLDAVLGVSSTQEEGEWPRGRVVVVEPSQLDAVRFICRFPAAERPRLEDHKHVRKLLQAVEDSGRALVSDGESVLGVAIGAMPGAYMTAQFRGSHGYLWLRDALVCSFYDGSFHSSNMRANLVQLEELLLETRLDMEVQHELMQVISLMVNRVRARKHGCTLVIDAGESVMDMSGQHFETPLDLRVNGQLKLACSLAKLDGALHLGADLRLHGFGCLMDGRSVPGENLARGARYNSALRFTAEHDDLMVVVVSADRPVSVIRGGVDVTAVCRYEPVHGLRRPPLLAEWIMN